MASRGPVMGEVEPEEIEDWHRRRQQQSPKSTESKRNPVMGEDEGVEYDASSAEHSAEWEYDQGHGTWAPYDPDVTALLESAFQAQSADGSTPPVKFKNRFGSYRIDWERQQQVNERSGGRRTFRRRVVRSPSNMSRRAAGGNGGSGGNSSGGGGGDSRYNGHSFDQRSLRLPSLPPPAEPNDAYRATMASLVQWQSLNDGQWCTYDDRIATSDGGGSATVVCKRRSSYRTGIADLDAHLQSRASPATSFTAQLEAAFATTSAGVAAAKGTSSRVEALGWREGKGTLVNSDSGGALRSADGGSNSHKIEFAMQKTRYTLDVDAMTQTNVSTGTVRPVRRVLNGRQTHPPITISATGGNKSKSSKGNDSNAKKIGGHSTDDAAKTQNSAKKKGGSSWFSFRFRRSPKSDTASEKKGKASNSIYTETQSSDSSGLEGAPVDVLDVVATDMMAEAQHCLAMARKKDDAISTLSSGSLSWHNAAVVAVNMYDMSASYYEAALRAQTIAVAKGQRPMLPIKTSSNSASGSGTGDAIDDDELPPGVDLSQLFKTAKGRRGTLSESCGDTQAKEMMQKFKDDADAAVLDSVKLAIEDTSAKLRAAALVARDDVDIEDNDDDDDDDDDDDGGGGGGGANRERVGDIRLQPSVFYAPHCRGDFSFEIRLALRKEVERARTAMRRGKPVKDPYLLQDHKPPGGLTLYIFNDNDRDHGTPVRGGNNAIIRQFNRHSTFRPVRAAGICTGDGIRGGGFQDPLTGSIKAIIDRDVAEVRALLDSGCYSRVVYSASGAAGDPTALGTGIFDVGEEIKNYIIGQLRAAVRC